MKRKLWLAVIAVKMIFRNAARSIFGIPAGIVLYLLFFREKKTHYIIVNDHIGDFILTMGYLDAFRKYHGYTHVTLCITDKFASLLHAYEKDIGPDAVKVLGRNQLYCLLNLGSTHFGSYLTGQMKKVTLINPANQFTGNNFRAAVRYPNLTFCDCIRYGDMKLPETASFCSPNFSCFPSYPADKRGNSASRDRTVLLVPDARSVKRVPAAFFEALVKCLNDNGFQVVTNVTGDNGEPVSGTDKIKLPLDMMPVFAQMCGYVIGTRNGLMDLLSYADCRLVSLYVENDPARRFFDMEAFPGHKARVHQFLLSGDIGKDIERLLIYFQEEDL